MKTKTLLLILLFNILCNGKLDAFRYAGGDISLLPEYENAGAKYYDGDGQQITDFISYCHDKEMNAMRVRLFVNPENYRGSDKDANACQDLKYILPLCKRIKDAGHALMLDFHYSDTWADPGKQWTPAAWENLTDEELYARIYDYTKGTLEALAEIGVSPEFIQTGNEISYGMLWGKSTSSSSSLKKVDFYSGSFTGANYVRFGKLLSNAIKACRMVCPDAKIVLHNERVAQPQALTNFYDWMRTNNIDYDVIGLSYYPYFHGKMDVLNTALTALEGKGYGKDIMIVETGYPYAWEVPGTNQKVDYEYSEAGQNDFATALVETVKKHPSCNGIFWWWMEYNAKGTSLRGWYNAPLVDSNTGKVQRALSTIASYVNEDIEPDKPGSVTDVIGDESEAVYYNLQGIMVENPGKGVFVKVVNGNAIKVAFK